MRLFTLSKKYHVICNTENTRNGFKHTAALLYNGNEVYRTKMNYINRTWERYTYESVLYCIVNDKFVGKELQKFIKIIKNGG